MCSMDPCVLLSTHTVALSAALPVHCSAGALKLQEVCWTLNMHTDLAAFYPFSLKEPQCVEYRSICVLVGVMLSGWPVLPVCWRALQQRVNAGL
jgi:hypothetical protein